MLKIMKNTATGYLLTLVSILLSITMLAQEAYAQPGIGVDPEKDSLSMKDLQAYLSKISVRLWRWSSAEAGPKVFLISA